MKISANVFALQEMIIQNKNNFVLIFEQINLSTLIYRKEIYFVKHSKGSWVKHVKKFAIMVVGEQIVN